MLILDNISYSYGPDLKSFSMNIPELRIEGGKISCLLGRNGSGKTTLLSLIAGHILPQSGTILLNGVDISQVSPQKRPISTVFQQIGLFPHLTVLENIELAIEPNYLFKPSMQARERARDVLVRYELFAVKDKKPEELSVGQQQKVAVARALSCEPQVLLLDEPTSALDFENIRALRELLTRVKSQQIVPIILIVSHDLPFVMSIADDIKFLEQGSIVFEGDRETFSTSMYHII